MFISYQNVKVLMQRYYIEYKQLMGAFFFGDVLERVMFFIAFGVGLGRAVSEIDGVSYITFLAPGIAAGSGVFIMSIATTYGVHNRYSGSGIWQSWLATPIRIQDILLSELIFDAFRATPSLFILYVVAYFFGAVPSIEGALLTIPILVLANLVYGVITLNLGALLGRMLYFRYIQALWVMPMYLFSGVFFNIDEAPVWMQYFANIFPLYHVLEIVRPMVLGRSIEMEQVIVSFVILVAIFLIGFYIAYKQFQKRLFD